MDLWALIEEQGYYESEDDLDEDDFDSESTHFTDSSDGEEYEEDEDMISVPQVGFDDNVNMETQQEQLMESISENVEGGFGALKNTNLCLWDGNSFITSHDN